MDLSKGNEVDIASQEEKKEKIGYEQTILQDDNNKQGETSNKSKYINPFTQPQ